MLLAKHLTEGLEVSKCYQAIKEVNLTTCQFTLEPWYVLYSSFDFPALTLYSGLHAHCIDQDCSYWKTGCVVDGALASG